MTDRRDQLALAAPNTTMHAGLWLEGYVESFEKPVGEHLSRLFRTRNNSPSLIEIPEGYRHFFERHRQGLADLPPATRLGVATVSGRLALGLGGESVLETAIRLHRTWGVPYLPGSALKGLAAAAARLRLDPKWDPESLQYRTLFGDTKDAGHVVFHDALWQPPERAGDPLPLTLDVMTVHHKEYYGYSGAAEPPPPADWDDPNPVSFVTAHGSYLLALTGPPDWVELAWQILADALEHDGIGAKTAAGYGRMKVER